MTKITKGDHKLRLITSSFLEKFGFTVDQQLKANFCLSFKIILNISNFYFLEKNTCTYKSLQVDFLVIKLN